MIGKRPRYDAIVKVDESVEINKQPPPTATKFSHVQKGQGGRKTTQKPHSMARGCRYLYLEYLELFQRTVNGFCGWRVVGWMALGEI